ncbi:FMN-binding negative transcriptional regulator [Methylobacterium sp. J-070]|uniref:FMN-binding negative transcriptional regulator n=1 Tax=Methylobacterium sp. J-070 TaxID=2836650 RepID=UPI001FB9259D|nr:FMN-binding negative transcriptional regulator [Methylobacterium sp. J-070]MCJ2049471.1 FMN-binding negative transcriptional regulator [Methylobacterium sp. J-070]
MYVHPAFQTTRERGLDLLRERAYGTFAVPTSAAPSAVHLPFLTYEDGKDTLRIELHVARANTIHTHVGDGCPALLMCTGPDAYISPDWYGMPNEVPTWTYTAVHLTGTARVLPAAVNQDHVDRMVAYFEERMPGKAPWTSARLDPSRMAMMMKAIVTIEMRVEGVEAQLKLIQHKDEVRHRGAIGGLRRQPDAGSHAIADLMQETLDTRLTAQGSTP